MINKSDIIKFYIRNIENNVSEKDFYKLIGL